MRNFTGKNILKIKFNDFINCDALFEELNELDKEIDEGKGIVLNVDNLERHFGL